MPEKIKRLYGDITEEQLKKFLFVKGVLGHRADGATLGYIIDEAYAKTQLGPTLGDMQKSVWEGIRGDD